MYINNAMFYIVVNIIDLEHMTTILKISQNATIIYPCYYFLKDYNQNHKFEKY